MKRRGRVLIVATVALLPFGGAAVAHMSSAGAGLGTVATGLLTVQLETLQVGDVPANSLIPGGTSDLTLRVANNSAGAVRVTDVVQNGTIVSSLPGCTVPAVTFSSPTIAANDANYAIPAHTQKVIRIAGSVSMGTAASNGCQGSSFTVPIRISVLA